MVRKVAGYIAGIYITLFVGSFLSILVKSIIAKELGKEVLGTYTYFLSIQAILGIIFAFGIPDIITKAQSEEDINGNDLSRFSIGAILFIMLVSIIIGIALIPVSPLLTILSIMIVGPVTLMPVATAVFRAEFSTKRETSYRLIRRISEALLLIIGVFVLATTNYPEKLAAFLQIDKIAFNAEWNQCEDCNLLPVIALVASWFIATFYLMFILARRHLFVSPRRFLSIAREKWLWRSFYSASFLWIANILGIIGIQIDRIIVGNTIGLEQLGEYSGALLFYGLLGQVLEIWGRIYVSILPRGRNRSFERYKLISEMTALLVPLIGFGTLVFVPIFTPILLDDTYTLVLPLFAILSFTFVFKALELVNLALSITVNVPQINLKSTLISLPLYFPALYILIDNLGLYGAAISQVIYWALYTVFQIYYLKASQPQHAAYSALLMLKLSALFLATMAVYALIDHEYLDIIAAPTAYIVMGQLIGAWDLRVFLKIVLTRKLDEPQQI